MVCNISKWCEAGVAGTLRHCVCLQYEVFNYSRYSPLTKIVFAIFMILMPILLLNMLIAMMGNTYNQVIAKSEKEWRRQVPPASLHLSSPLSPLSPAC